MLQVMSLFYVFGMCYIYTFHLCILILVLSYTFMLYAFILYLSLLHPVPFVYFIYICTFLFYHILYVFVYFLHFSCVGLKPILSYHIFHISHRSTGLLLLLSSHILSYVFTYVFMYFLILYCHIIYGFHVLLTCTVFMY